MAHATLLEKAYPPFSAKTFKPYLEELCRDLDVKLQVSSTGNGWIRVEVAGEDEKVALKYLSQQVGFAPETINNVAKFSTFKGRVIASKSRTELHVDVGVFRPEPVLALVPLQRLQAQLSDGKKFALQKIVELYGLENNVPLNVKIVEADAGQSRMWAEFSHAQLAVFEEWIKATVDRLLVLGSLRSYVDSAVKASGHARDVVRVESLGLLDHAVICKLGTDAAGLIPRLGGRLKTALLVPFSPKKILELVDRR